MKAGWGTAKARAVARGAHIGPTPVGYQRTPKGEPGSGSSSPTRSTGPAITKLFERAGHGDETTRRWRAG